MANITAASHRTFSTVILSMLHASVQHVQRTSVHMKKASLSILHNCRLIDFCIFEVIETLF